MPGDGSSSSVMSARGFTLVELLVTSTIVLAIAGALAAAIGPAREVFARVPEELDLQQRARTAVDAIARPLRSSLTFSVGADGASIVVTVPAEGQGLVDVDQANPASSLVLATAGCPSLNDLCGLTAGNLAMVRDKAGATDIFTIAAMSIPLRMVTPGRALSRAYVEGATVAAVDQYTFRLDPQSDGSLSMVRQTAAGAVQPVVDFVSGLSFSVLAAEVTISIRIHPATQAMVPSRVFTAVVAARNAS